MRQWWPLVFRSVGSLVIAGTLGACAASKPAVPPPTPPPGAIVPPEETPVPTVPPATPTPPPTAAPLSTRPVGREDAKSLKGQAIGPEITHFGAARADGKPVPPASTEGGIPTYVANAGAGFIIVVEAKAGSGGHEVGRRIFAYMADDPTVRPDLEIISSKDLGDGSKAVCDRMKPVIGGIPSAKSFAEDQATSNAINDLSCRFETFNESDSSCTVTENGDFSFVSADTQQQFCMIVARAWSFPVGDTILTARVRDMKGNPGPPKKLRIRRPPEVKAPAKPKEVPTPAGPKPLPTRGS